MSELPADPELEHATSVLRLLADRTRLGILALLADQELTVTALAEALDRPVPAVSQHLAKLRTAGLVVVRRQGTSSHYRQPDEHLAALVTNALQFAEHAVYAEAPHHRSQRHGVERPG
ncbi:ArsR/SmtB family transcription factor [Aestuariimicrobium soli]|uniref:ArsR/SmtB family transcription factor n=1 Tax=Aestuariimicrobium soli TaxID=2035834 RepID=UPI003EBD1E70